MKTTAHKHNVHEMLFVMMVILSVVTWHLIMWLILVPVMNIQQMHNKKKMAVMVMMMVMLMLMISNH